MEELEITLEMLIAWHQRRAQDCTEIMARATYVPTPEREALTAMTKFHQAVVRQLETLRERPKAPSTYVKPAQATTSIM
jgi:hypothetical protein